MSTLYRQSLLALALAAVTVPIAIPIAATAGSPSGQSDASVLYVDSDALPEGQTGVSNGPSAFTVTAATTEAKKLKLSLDGKELPDRTFSPFGQRARTQFQLTPTVGWHQLTMTVIDCRRQTKPDPDLRVRCPWVLDIRGDEISRSRRPDHRRTVHRGGRLAGYWAARDRISRPNGRFQWHDDLHRHHKDE
jgi:hypothetical protein